MPAWGFEAFSSLWESSKTCQTTCHLTEMMKKIKLNKKNEPSCKACHGGIVIDRSRSPFSKEPRFKNISSPSLLTKKKASNPGFQTNQPKPTTAKIPPKNMAFIPGGKFIMGSNGRWDDESPEHFASTKAFYIDFYEVTNRDYKKFVDAVHINPPFHWPEGKPPKNKLDHPVVYVNWFEANKYCHWAGKRLPNEAEWEKSARGPEGNIYPWGNVWVLDKSNNPYNNATGTKTVGSYPKGRSPYGLYDMSGNVWEWVDSFYLPHPGNEISRPEYGRKNRVLKGGSWFDCLSYGCGISAPTFNRSFFTPEVRNNSFGFRCAKSATSKKTTTVKP